MSEHRRRSLSKITEGTQALVGVIDITALELDKPSLGRKRSHEGRSAKPSPRSGDGTLRRRGSIGASFGSDPDMALILQNSGLEGGAVTSPGKGGGRDDFPIPLRRVNSESDATGLRKTRRSFESLQSISKSKVMKGESRGPSPSSSRRSSFDPDGDLQKPNSSRRSSHGSIPSLSRHASVESDKSDEKDLHVESTCLRNASKAIAAMPGRTIASVKKKPKYGVMDATSKRGITLLTHNIALGGRDDANNIQKLRKFGITHILNVARQMPLFFPGEFVYLKIPLEDTDDTDVREVMPQASAFLAQVEKVNGRVLVHCISGVSRSTTVVLMYLMQQHNMCLLDCYGYVRSCRPFIEPNKGFRLQLAEAELRKFGSSSVATKAAGKVFNFYEWNIKKEHVKIKKMGGTDGLDEDDWARKKGKQGGCVEWFIRTFVPR